METEKTLKLLEDFDKNILAACRTIGQDEITISRRAIELIESLKDKIEEQETKITELKEENEIFRIDLEVNFTVGEFNEKLEKASQTIFLAGYDAASPAKDRLRAWLNYRQDIPYEAE